MQGEDAGAPLFAVFIISLFSLFLIPLTIYKLCKAAGDDDAAKPWEAAEDKKTSFVVKCLRKLRRPSTLVLVLGWLVLFGLIFYVQQYAKEMSPFDPFDILKIDRKASDQDVKRAYRRLSLQYHPDKNPDPSAVNIYLQINQAYRALTDAEARKNWEKFGHPDGKQAVDMGIALPSWIMGNESNGPLILAALVMVGIVLPLGAAAWFLLSSSKFSGPNQVMAQTIEMFVRTKLGVKEGQSLPRIPDTLVFAMEFILMPVPPEQQQALEILRKEVLRNHPDLKEKPQWFKRRTSIVKTHMLLLAHMDRSDIPKVLHKDLDFILRKSVILLEEMIKVANIPRTMYSPCGWLTPTIGCVELLQCITQAVSIGSRKTFTHGKAGADSQAPMLQLPYMTMDVIKRLTRKKIRGLSDLLLLPADERIVTLTASGLREKEAHATVMSLLSIPVITVNSAAFVVDGEVEGTEVVEEDIVTCSMRIVLRRAAHSQEGYTPPKGKTVLAYAPHCPVPRQERWYAILADAPNNAVLVWTPVNLVEAERAGIETARRDRLARKAAIEDSSGGKEATTQNGQKPEGKEVEGQLIDLKFRAPRQGKYDLHLYMVSDSWLGCDRIMPVKLKVNELSRAEKEGRTHRGKQVVVEKAEGSDKANSEEEDDETEEEEDYDSEESSDEESGDDESDSDSDSQQSDKDKVAAPDPTNAA